MPSSKSQTPVSAGVEHPLHSVALGDEEERAALFKVGPAVLPNNTTVDSLKENYPNDPRWSTFRSDFRYIYVMNWMYQCRGYIKLASEHFDADLFEIELFDLVHPRPVDDMALLVNKTKLGLLSKIHGKKVSSLASFESLFRVYFGSETPLAGAKDEDEEVHDTSIYPMFDDLYIDEKISILYEMVVEVTQYPDFRDFVDKNKLGPDALRPASIMSNHSKNQNSSEDYILLFDNTALYKRVIKCPELSVPRKRKLAPKYPEEEYGSDAFDVASVNFELIFKDIYGLDAFVKTLTPKKAKKNKMLLDVLTKRDFVSNIFSYEIRKRKILSNRRKDFEMTRLLATRKRSSRIEAKEKQREHEEQERKLRELEELQYATNRRSQRTRNQIEQQIKMDYTDGLSREERLKMRKGMRENEGENSEVATETPISILSSVEPVEIITSDSDQPNQEQISQSKELPVELESKVYAVQAEDPTEVHQHPVEVHPQPFQVEQHSDQVEKGPNKTELSVQADKSLVKVEYPAQTANSPLAPSSSSYPESESSDFITHNVAPTLDSIHTIPKKVEPPTKAGGEGTDFQSAADI